MKSLTSAINRAWRIAMTGLCFTLFGLGGLMLSLVWFNLLLLVQRNPETPTSWARRSISCSFRFFYAHHDGRAGLPH